LFILQLGGSVSELHLKAITNPTASNDAASRSCLGSASALAAVLDRTMTVGGSNSKLTLNFEDLNSESAEGLNFVAAEESSNYLWDIGGGIAYSNRSGKKGKFSIDLSW